MTYRLYYHFNDKTVFLPSMTFTDKREAENWRIRWNALEAFFGEVYIFEESV